MRGPDCIGGRVFVMRLGVALAACLSTGLALAQSAKLAEPYTDARTFQIGVEVKTDGDVLTAGVKGVDKLPLAALAQFQLRERRLPPAGRDAQALRAVREYEIARLSTDVSGEKSVLELPASMRIVVAEGRQEGVINFSPTTTMTRDAVDLLELPGDSLCLLAMLPLGEVSVGDTWSPPEWAAQMLAGIEAVESSALNCKLDSVTEGQATISFEGNVKGQRLGANTHSEVRGRMVYDVAGEHIREAAMAFKIKAGVGTVVPGLDVTVSVRMARRVAADAGGITEDLVAKIPLEIAADRQQLAFDAPPWGVRLRHGRDWHVFKTLFDGQPPTAILRLMERGSLICQCNMSPIANAAAGDHTPVEQFESDIQKSLGKKFRRVVSQDQIPSTDGRFIYRVVVEGEVELATSKKAEDGKSSTSSTIQVPMNWIYYLCAERTGRQMSFVFSVEPPLVEQLAERDRKMVESLEFYRPVTASTGSDSKK